MSKDLAIDTLMLEDSPIYNKDSKKESLYPDLKLKILNEVTKGKPGCFLITGHKGVGKTSLLEEIAREEALSNDSVIVRIPFVKDTAYEYALRKIIRSLYLSVEANHTKDEVERNYSSLFELYIRTFNQLERSRLHHESEEENQNLKFKISLYKYFTIIFTMSFGITGLSSKELFSLYFNFLDEAYLRYTISIISIVFSIFKSIEVSGEYKRAKKFSKSLEVKDLYDEEIAEYRLLQVLSDIGEKSKTIIILDELDKFSSVTELQTFLSTIKTLLLSGKAYFFIIAGPEVILNVESSKVKNDHFLSSLFSRHFHVPKIEYNHFVKMFLKFTSKTNLDFEDEVTLKAILFKSRFITRRFISELRSRVSWSEDSAFIATNVEDENLSELCDIYLKFSKSNQLIGATKGYYYQDNISSYVLIWLEMIFSKRGSFKVSSVFNFNELNEIYSNDFLRILERLFKDLLSYLVLDLEKIKIESNKAIDELSLLTKDGTKDLTMKVHLKNKKKTSVTRVLDEETINKFIQNYDDLSQFYREFAKGLNHPLNLESDLVNFFDVLSKYGRGSISESDHRLIFESYELFRRIRNNSDLDDYDHELANKFNLKSKGIIIRILQVFTELFIDERYRDSDIFIVDHDFSYEKGKILRPDFVIRRDGELAFVEVKYLRSTVGPVRDLIFRTLGRYFSVDNQFKLIFILYVDKSNKNLDRVVREIDLVNSSNVQVILASSNESTVDIIELDKGIRSSHILYPKDK